MPHPDDDFFDLPEYPVRPAAPTLRFGASDSVWARYPMGSRIVAALAITCLLAPVVAFFRGNGGPSASAETAMVDGAVLDVTAGPDVSVADRPAVVTAPAEGTLPPTIATPATLPRTTPTPATTVPTKKAAVAPQTSTVQVVKPSTATTAKKVATTAKPVVKPAATTQATTKQTTAATVVKPPAEATTPRTTRPAATTEATAAPPQQQWSTDDVEALIRQMWPADSLDKALRVAFRESRYQADAYNGWCCYGVFQINGASHKHRLAARGLTTAALLDPRVNIEIALELYNEQGWGPWGG